MTSMVGWRDSPSAVEQEAARLMKLRDQRLRRMPVADQFPALPRPMFSERPCYCGAKVLHVAGDRSERAPLFDLSGAFHRHAWKKGRVTFDARVLGASDAGA